MKKKYSSFDNDNYIDTFNIMEEIKTLQKQTELITNFMNNFSKQQIKWESK